MSANNEIGCINQIDIIGNIANRKNIPFHTDAVQTFGKYKMNLTRDCIDAVSVSFHKLYGPMGIGMLIINKQLVTGYDLDGQIAGSQHGGLRGGTENVPAIAGAYAALKHTFVNRVKKNKRLENMRQSVINALCDEYEQLEYESCFKVASLPEFGFVVIGPTNVQHRVPNTLFVSFVMKNGKFCNTKLKKALNMHNIVVSIGSACNTSSAESSHVMQAIRAPSYVKKGVIRISFGDYNTSVDVKKFCKLLIKSVNTQVPLKIRVPPEKE